MRVLGRVICFIYVGDMEAEFTIIPEIPFLIYRPNPVSIRCSILQD